MTDLDIVSEQINEFVQGTTTLVLDHGSDELIEEYAKLLKKIKSAL